MMFGGSTPVDIFRREAAMRFMAAMLGDFDVSQSICDRDPRYNGNNFGEVVALNAVEFAYNLTEALDK